MTVIKTANVIEDTVSASSAKHHLHAVLCRNRYSWIDMLLNMYIQYMHVQKKPKRVISVCKWPTVLTLNCRGCELSALFGCYNEIPELEGP